MKHERATLDMEEVFADDNISKSQPLNILSHLYAGHTRKLVWSSFFYVIKSSPTWVMPIITANIINIAVNPGEHQAFELWLNLGVLVILLLQNIPTNALYMKFMSKAIRHVEAGLRSTLVRKLQHLSISFHSDLRSGKMQSKVLRDVEAIEFLSKQMMISVLPAAFNVIIAIILTSYHSWTVMLFFVVTIPISLVLVSFFRKKMRLSNHEFRREVEEMSGKMSEMVEMIPVTRAHGLEKVEIDKMDDALYHIKEKGHRLDMLEAYFGASNWVTFQLVQAGCLIFTAYLAYTGKIPAGDIVMYQGFFNMILGSVTGLINIYPQMAKGFESIHSVTEVLMSKDIESYQGKKKCSQLTGKISFEHVHFTYQSGHTHVLNDFHLDVRPGESVAFVGASGAGKSTVLNMILGFHQPTSGQIRVDNIPLSELDMQSYRQHISMVPQHTLLFSGTIRDNITYGLPTVSEDRLKQVIDMANLHEVIEKLPHGLDTLVGEHGGKLSGGQRQRIAIARALIREPKLIILDEATSALDNVSERHVQRAMQELIKGRTTFIVAHRLSTIRDVDRIVVMEQGRCVEMGSYEELMARRGAFYALHLANQGIG
ncbi:ABC transporter ATP-binding protein [Marinicrinis sediminis]|uniref:ABC transporter ATP-binding protein n=1 Tax=Marinicrinis sediminis TaxID=1652465 RepID=A0ABW5RCC8_9BACL